MAKILLVEDDKHIAYLIQFQLAHDRHIVDVCTNGGEALAVLRTHDFDLVILDWMLPDLSGVDVCQQFRGGGGTTPILMLTARSSAQDKITGLDSGCDDYLVKPFNPEELNARVRALLRRPPQIAGRVLKVGEIELDTSTYKVSRNAAPVDLLPKEFAILELLMRHPNQYFSSEAILDRVWQSDANASIDSVRTHIKTLRRKLGDSDSNETIQNTRGLGYRIKQ